MLVIRTIADLRERIAVARAQQLRVGFVPTMGALHAGHVSLVTRASIECDMTVVSVFVNPKQFDNAADLSAYPRTESSDAALLQQAGVDILFVPTTNEMYPNGFTTTIDVGPITLPLEGATRGAHHFHGVATVVLKLLNIVQPDAVYFGQKDAQQLLVIRQLVRDLNVPVEIIACDTVRDADGLAISSRNVRLTMAARAQALGLSSALFHMREMVMHGERQPEAVVRGGRNVLAAFGIAESAIDYLAVVNPHTLLPLSEFKSSVLMAVAAHIDGVRLIDNIIVQLAAKAVA